MTYDMAKTELVLFIHACQRRLNQQVQETTVLIRGEKTKFNKKELHLLRIWLDSQLKFTAYIIKQLTRAKQQKFR